MSGRKLSNVFQGLRLFTRSDEDYQRCSTALPPLPDIQDNAVPLGVPDYGKGIALLAKSGWTQGEGLGRNAEGRAAPLEINEKYDTKGLGYSSVTEGTIPNSMNGKHQKPTRRDTRIQDIRIDPVQYLKYPGDYLPTADFSIPNSKILGPRTDTVDYDLYCDSSLVEALFECKNKLDGVETKFFLPARKKSNPYEIIAKAMFINRAAVKLANLDYLCNLVPRDNSQFYFCDVCAGPGGFSEYLLWRKKDAPIQGWGMTLKGNEDWTLDKFHPDCRVHDRFFVSYGVDGTGSVYNNENLEAFQALVLRGTQRKGVHLFTADGGISVDGNENYQEIEVKRLVLCQFLCMFMVLSKGGTFVCKIFDCFTPFTVGLLYLLYRHFEEFSVLKPCTSRPANSERYVVCRNLREFCPSITEHLKEVNALFDNYGETNSQDILHVIDPELVQSDHQFIQYIRKFNLDFIKVQIDALKDLVLYIEDGLLEPYCDQIKIKEKALAMWSIPDAPPRSTGKRRGGYQGFHGGHQGGYNKSRSNPAYRDHRDYHDRRDNRNYYDNRDNRDNRDRDFRDNRDNRDRDNRDNRYHDRNDRNDRRDYRESRNLQDYPIPQAPPPRADFAPAPGRYDEVPQVNKGRPVVTSTNQPKPARPAPTRSAEFYAALEKHKAEPPPK